MECECGYIGKAEIGDFNDNIFHSGYTHFRCPKCKSNKNIKWLHPIDGIREVLIYPQGKTVRFTSGGRDNKTIGFCILNKNNWGHASAIPIQEFIELKEEFAGKLDLDRITTDADTELRKMGIDPLRLNEFFKSSSKLLEESEWYKDLKKDSETKNGK